MKSWLWKVKAGLAAAAVFIIWLMRGQLDRAKKEAARQRDRAEVAETVRRVEREVNKARSDAREDAREAEKAHEKHRRSGTRPQQFGDPRLRDAPDD